MRARTEEIDALLAQAEAGGNGAASAARRAAHLAEAGDDPRRARAALRLAVALGPLDPSPRLALARHYAEAGDLDAAKAEAGAVFADAIDQAARARAAFMLGEIARACGELGAAREAFAATLEIEDQLLARDRTDPSAGRWYARARGRLAELDALEGLPARAGAEGALAMLRACAAQLGETPALAADIADAELRLAAIELEAGSASAAQRRLGEALGRYEALALQEPNEPHWRAMLADCWMLLGDAGFAAGNAEAARAAMDKAIVLRKKLARDDARERLALVGALRRRAALLAGLDDDSGAAETLAQALQLGEVLRTETGGGEAPSRLVLHTLLDRAQLEIKAGRSAAALAAADAARQLGEAFASAPASTPAWRSDLASVWERIGAAQEAAGAAAIGAFERAVEFRRQALDAAPQQRAAEGALAATLSRLGQAAAREHSAHVAYAAHTEAAGLRLELAEAAPGNLAAAFALADALEQVGSAAAALGDAHAARQAWEQQRGLAAGLIATSDTPAVQRLAARAEALLASLGADRTPQ